MKKTKGKCWSEYRVNGLSDRDRMILAHRRAYDKVIIAADHFFARRHVRSPVDMTDVILACDPGPAEPVGMVVRVAKSRNPNGQMIRWLSPNGFRPLLPKPETVEGQPSTKKEDSSDDGIF